MKVGDLVKKVRGDSDLGATGLVTDIQTNSLGVTILSVSCSELRHALVQSWWPGTVPRHKNWLAEYCEVVSEIS